MSARARLALVAFVCAAFEAACSGGGGSGASPNAPPVASAGVAQIVPKGDLVTLDAGGSKDPEGAALSYRWTQTAGTPVVLSSSTEARPTFTAPRSSGRLSFSLVVNDGKLDSAAVTVDVAVQNRAPTAVASGPTYGTSGTVLTLDGRASSDPDGDALTCTWWQTSGPAVTLIDRGDGTASFLAPLVNGWTPVTFALRAGDGEAQSDVQTVVVTLLPPTVLMVSAGPDRTVARGSAVYLSAYAGGAAPFVTWSWTQTSGPAVALGQAATPYATFTAPAVECDLAFQVIATSGDATAGDEVVVHVRNIAPTIQTPVILPAQPHTGDDLSVSASIPDPDGDPVSVTYRWTRNGDVIPGATASSLPASETTRGDVIAVVVTASDGSLSATATASTTILDSPPVLSSSPPTQVTYGQSISFQVTAVDPDGDPVGDLVLAYGPAGMQVTPGGLVTWTARLPMFDRSMEVRWAVAAREHPEAPLTGTLRVEDPQRQYPLYRSGIEIPVWRAGLQVTDLDGDGHDEMLVASNDVLYELGRTGSGYAQRWAYPFSPGAASTSYATIPNLQAVVARDLDGDGRQEIFLASGNVLIELDGVSRREVARYDSGGAFTCVDLKVADLDGDGNLELVCLGAAPGYYYPSKSQVVVLDAKTLTVKWQTAMIDNLGGTLAVGNVDDDAALEIVTSGGYVFDGVTHQSQWTYSGTNGFGRLVDVGDLDGDGVAEIVGSGDGTRLTVYSARLRSPIADIGNSMGALFVTDIDGDGKAEILVGSGSWGGVTAYRYDAATNTIVLSCQLNPQYDGVSAIGVGDVDGDGAKEIVWGAGLGDSGADSFVIAGPGLGAVEWTNVNPNQLGGPFVGARLARLGGGATRVVYAVARTNSAYGGARLIALDPATGGLQVSKEIASDWNAQASLDVADYDRDGVDELLFASTSYYGSPIFAYDLVRDAAEWTSQALATVSAASVTHADLNGDGFDDLVAITANGYLYAFDAKNQALLWRSTAIGSRGIDVATADLDGDGTQEIVALTSDRIVAYRKIAGPIGYVEAAAATVTDPVDLVVADCDGDGSPEIYVLTGASFASASILRFDADLKPLGSVALGVTAASLHLEDIGSGRKNLVVSVGNTSYGTATPRLLAVDAVTGAEIWRSPGLWGTVPINSLSYVDVRGDGEREIAFGTTYGMYLTR